MKILLLVGSREADAPIDSLSPATIKGTGTVYNFFLRREFARMPDVEAASYRFSKIRDPDKAARFLAKYDPPAADHVICLEQRGFSASDASIAEFFRRRVPGAVCAICDHDQVLGPEDYLFHVQFTRHHPPDPRSVQVTWAASPEYCYPDKEKGVLNILVDHNNYSGEDRGDEIVDQLCAFALGPFEAAKRAYGFDRIVIRQLVSGGVALIDPANPQRFAHYDRRGMPFPDVCREYRRADIFFVTKPESMGLSILECAMSGALIVYPRGYANSYLLEPLNHIVWDDRIDFDDVLAALDVEWSARRAAPFNWQHLAQLIVNRLRLHGLPSPGGRAAA
jgi:hypothetical protein